MFPLADTAKEKGPRAITKLLIAVNTGVFFWQVWLSVQGKAPFNRFVGDYALVAERLMKNPLAGDAWLPVLTHMFLHGGWLHLLGNMWFLWVFGGNVEWRLGPARYLLFYLLAGIAAAFAQIAAGPFSSVPMVGASGAISGLMGAYLILFPTAWVLTLVPWIVPILPVPALLFLPLWFLLQAYAGVGALMGQGGDGVAWWAHAGGFLAGVAMAMYARKMKWVKRG